MEALKQHRVAEAIRALLASHSLQGPSEHEPVKAEAWELPHDTKSSSESLDEP
jgi:hypothetical protein